MVPAKGLLGGSAGEFRGEGRNFVGGSFFGALFGQFCVDPALKPSANQQMIPGMVSCGFPGCPSPENTGKIIRPLKYPGYSQHNIAYFPPEGGSAQIRFPAQRTFQNHFIYRVAILTQNASGENKNIQPPPAFTADVMGADLSGDSKHGAA